MTRRMHFAKSRPAHSLRSRLFVRALEARCVPATFTVTTTADSGPGSFRQACIDASANAAFDEIQFSSLFDSDQTISLTSQVTLASDAKITGPTAGKLTIAGTGGGRIMYFNLASAVATATISSMRFTGGNTAGRGGAIFVGTSEKLTLTDCIVENNKAADSGGAINVNNGGSLTLQRCSITGNQGGIGTTGYRVGGGIYFRNSGNLLVENTTISGNTAAFGGGGGVYFYGNASGGNITIRNSTISGNTSAGIGGGIALYKFSSGSVLLQNVTLVNNTAVGDGGGVIQSDSPVSFSVESTVIANNTAGGASQDFAGALLANFSLVRDQTGTTLQPGSANNLAASTDPLLGPLAANGGGYLTHLPLAGSPLIDNGSNPTGLTTDQRGVGFARVVGQADIGAIEVQAAAGTPSAKSTPPNVTKAGETSYTFSVAYEDDLAVKGSTIGTGDITVLGPSPANFSQVASLVSVVPGGDGSPLVATYTITAPGGAWNDTHNAATQSSSTPARSAIRWATSSRPGRSRPSRSSPREPSW